MISFRNTFSILIKYVTWVTLIAAAAIYTGCASVSRIIPPLPGSKANHSEHVYAQSGKGTIGLGAKRLMEKKGRVNLACTVDVIDPSGNSSLDMGETISLKITVRNFSMEHAINPKLEIIRQYGKDGKRIMDILFLPGLRPGQKTDITETVSWDMQYTDKTIFISIKAFDSVHESSSLTTAIEFPVTL